MASTGHVPNVSEEEAVILNAEGISKVKPLAEPSLGHRLKHALFGCTLIRYYEMNVRVGRAVLIGRICPYCFKRYPVE